MLVLGRKAGESLVIDGHIRITVLDVDGERVRIGIDAPRSVPVVRQELFDAVQDANREAASGALDPAVFGKLSAIASVPGGE